MTHLNNTWSCEKKASTYNPESKEVRTHTELADILYGPPESMIPRNEWTKKIEDREEEISKRQLRALNYNYQVLFGKERGDPIPWEQVVKNVNKAYELACIVPQERVTLEEVLNGGDTFCYLVM